ncbi:L-threo-3-deoxy-hexylosonate [Hortaea werneckii]|nr:L-threo-3-deoxy-hexylosonate [Hortaea werneckii]
MATSGSSTGRIRHGIYAPTMTFFDKQTEELDIPTIKKHAVRLAQAGLVGLVTMGSNGEAVHLTKEEKTAVTKATREALDEAGFKDVVVMQGCSEAGVRLTIDLCKTAAAAGAEAALILPPAYYRAQINETMLMDYYVAVAEGSRAPDGALQLPRLVEATKGKVCGAKFTDANTGKLTRLAYATNACSVKSQGSGWMAFGGIADFTMQTAISGGSGIIAGGANVMPKLCVKVWNLCQQGKYDEAAELQKVLSKGDWVLTKAAIAGTKAAIEMEFGYGGYPRSPLQRLTEEQRKHIKDGISEAMKIEHSL